MAFILFFRCWKRIYCNYNCRWHLWVNAALLWQNWILLVTTTNRYHIFIYLSGFMRYMDLLESCISGIDVNILKKNLNWIHKGMKKTKPNEKNTNHNVKVRYFIWLEFSKTKSIIISDLNPGLWTKHKPFWHEERSHLWGKYWQSNQAWVDFWLSISNEIKGAFQGLCVSHQIKSINDSSDQDL